MQRHTNLFWKLPFSIHTEIVLIFSRTQYTVKNRLSTPFIPLSYELISRSNGHDGSVILSIFLSGGPLVAEHTIWIQVSWRKLLRYTSIALAVNVFCHHIPPAL